MEVASRGYTELRSSYLWTSQLHKLTQDSSLICICKQKTFSPVSSINLSQKDKALPVKTSKPNFVFFFVYLGNSLLDYSWNFFDCYGSKPESHFARNLREFSVARSEELEVNQWTALDIHWLSSQSKRVKKTIHCFSIYGTKIWCFLILTVACVADITLPWLVTSPKHRWYPCSGSLTGT